MPAETRVAIYARFSTEMQNAASIEDQVRLCKERIEREGWKLVQVFQDRAQSGTTLLRPGYQALLAAVRDGAVDVVLAESLDRLTRDQEDVAALYKRITFAGIRLVTLAYNDIDELHVGLAGTMSALFLKQLAEKTRRGLRGRIEAGRSAGGRCYGYDVVRRSGDSAEPITGERRINQREAEIIRRIFRDYASGRSPKRIALMLNEEGVAAPRGGHWSASTINGNQGRGTGILNNDLYRGVLVWNRVRYTKHPETRRRRSRSNDATSVVHKDAPELRVVPEELWHAVKARQSSLDDSKATASAGPAPAPAKPFWAKQRPRYLFSGLMRCGVCGGGFSKISANHLGCSTRVRGHWADS